MVQPRSKQNNPEQKTRDTSRNLETEFGAEYNPVKASKQKYEKKQSQAVISKQHCEKSD
ncbi:glycogen biosynthesis protein GlgD [Bacillus sp. 2205SS5-2]|uniref:glycogen biosynthesis protein GlgD n=1 Tax=Bacillus sp. 2205SS5-2 TaxID=3109031 RepID=UPI003004593E